MNTTRKPVISTGMSLLLTALTLTLSSPLLAASAVSKGAAMPGKQEMARAKGQKPLAKKAPVATVALPATSGTSGSASSAESLSARQLAERTLSVTSSNVAGPAIVQTATPITAAPAKDAPTGLPATQTSNPYLAGWYRPSPAAALPAVAVAQLEHNVRYVSDSVTSIPSRLSDALPRIKTVRPIGGRDVVVANFKCPVEMMTGQYMLPANALREGVNGLLSRLNDTQLLKFDIQLVCS